jgi:CubicO group peptidase (beta-lactamase class C family)
MRYYLCCLFAGVTLACLPPSVPADEAVDKANAAKVDRLFETWNKPDSPGCALGIVRDGKLIVARGYGMANLDHGVPITAKSVFEVGSMTKSFTCVCLALLMDQGKLSPDDDILQVCAENAALRSADHDPQSHSCEDGLREYWHLMPLAGWNIDDAWTEKDVLALVTLQKAPTFKPGSKFAYSSTGYFLMGLAIERITGKSLARFADENVFQPLGMKSTYLEDNPARITKNRAVGYQLQPDGSLRRWILNSNTVGAWGLKTTVEDLFKWDQNFYASRLRDGPYVREFLKTGTLMENRNVLDATPNPRYRGLTRMGFTGGMPGFLAAFVRFPDQKFSVICLSNSWMDRPWVSALRIADIYLVDRLKDGKKADAVPTKYEFINIAESDLLHKVGAYRMKGTRMIWRVSVVKGKLALTDHLDGTYRWQALSPTRFRAMEGPHKGTNTLIFERRSDERFTMRLEVDDGSQVEFEPIQVVNADTKQLSEYTGRYRAG